VQEIVLINITGPDRPGLTAAFAGILARSDVQILDIGQAVIHDTLSFGILVQMQGGADKTDVLKDILFKGSELDQQVKFTPISAEDYAHWVSGQGKARHIVTLLARRITAEHIARLSTITARHGLNIDHIDRLSVRITE
jgi:phosphoserine phosphatase